MEPITTIQLASQQKQNIVRAVQEYGKKLFAFIRNRVNSREDAEDILQDVWVQFSNVVDAEPIEQTSAWLFRVARNRIIDQYRRQKPVSSEEELYIETEDGEEIRLKDFLLADDASPEFEQLKSIFWQELFSALSELPAEQREVFMLNELDEISFAEISERTGEKINTLISRKRYAVLHLRKRLQKLYKEITEQ